MNARRPVGVLVAVSVVLILLGVIAGFTWAVLTPSVTGEAVGDGRARIQPQEISEEFASIGTFVLVSVGFGIVAALVAWFAARVWRGVVGFVTMLGAVVAGSALAAESGMWLTGIRFDDPSSVAPGGIVHLLPSLWLEGHTRSGAATPWLLLICAPLAFGLVYLVCVLSSRSADLGVGDLVEEAPIVVATPPAPGY